MVCVMKGFIEGVRERRGKGRANLSSLGIADVFLVLFGCADLGHIVWLCIDQDRRGEERIFVSSNDWKSKTMPPTKGREDKRNKMKTD
jgi:hypothetical protein